jgi:hypothetical protein
MFQRCNPDTIARRLAAGAIGGMARTPGSEKGRFKSLTDSTSEARKRGSELRTQSDAATFDTLSGGEAR